MADETKRDKRIEEEALREVERLGVMQDIFVLWESMQFAAQVPGLLDKLKPLPTYAEAVLAHASLGEEVKQEVLKKSDPQKVIEHDALVREFNRDLAMIKMAEDTGRLQRYIQRARSIRERPL